MRAVFVLLVAAIAAHAQDEYYETVWIVGDDGELMGWPDPELGVEMLRTFKPFPVFKNLQAFVAESTHWSIPFLLAAGPTDLASLCDPERHLRKTNELLFDEQLVLWMSPPREADDPGDIGRSRMRLDQILRMRVLGSRGVRDAAEALRAMDEAATVDRIARRVAFEVAEMLEGRRRPAVDLPDLATVPSDADVLVVVDQRRIPPWRDAWGLLRTYWIREARQVLARLGAAFAPSDLCHAQWQLDRDSEMFYEFARRFGNARLHRTVLALRLVEGGAIEFRLGAEGMFECDRFAAGCVAAGARTRPREDSTTAELWGATVIVTRDRLLVSKGEWKPPGDGIPEDLAKLGCGGDDAIWIHCRKVPFADRLPVKGVETLTLRASFDGGVMLRCKAGFKDAEAAKAAAAGMEGWKGLELGPLAMLESPLRDVDLAAIARVKALLASLTVSVEGATVLAQCSLKGETPESLLRGVVDLQALYAWEEEEAEDK